VKCARCGEPHLTSACNLGTTEPRKCALCQGSHSTTYRGCQVYKELRNQRFNSNVISKVNKHIFNPNTTVTSEQPARAAVFNVPKTQRTQPQSNQASSRHITHPRSPIQHSLRDPRLNAPLYSDVLSKNLKVSSVTRPESRHFEQSQLRDQSMYNTTTNTNTQSHISNEQTMFSLDLFLTRFQDLVTPLISTLTLLINKLLSTHG
jgi:hypothetical protein